MVTYRRREDIDPLILKLCTLLSKAVGLKLRPLYFQVTLNWVAIGHNIIYVPFLGA